MASNPRLMQRYPTIPDLIPTARRRLPTSILAYLEHGAGREVLLKQNTAAYDRVKIIPRYTRDMREIDLSAELLGKQYAMPAGVAPIGLGGLIWPSAERKNLRAALKANVPMVLSAVSSETIENLATLAGDEVADTLWFQLYSPKDESIRWDLLTRAKEAGIDVLVVTLDVPGPMRRERSLRAGFSLVPKISLRNFAQSCVRPSWSICMLSQISRHGFPSFANFVPYIHGKRSIGNVARFVTEQINRQVLVNEIEQIRSRWQGKLVVKGVLHPADAKTMLALGADGLWISNHGGRQSDALPPALSMLQPIREAVGNVPIMIDSGVRSGLDAIRAITLGADFTFLGRGFYYGSAALGSRGPAHVMEILSEEFTQSMRQIGCQDIALLKQEFASKWPSNLADLR